MVQTLRNIKKGWKRNHKPCSWTRELLVKVTQHQAVHTPKTIATQPDWSAVGKETTRRCQGNKPSRQKFVKS